MLSIKQFFPNCVTFNSAVALAILFSGHLRSQESVVDHEQLVSFRASDGDKNHDRKKAGKGRKESKESRSRRKPQENQNPKHSRVHHDEVGFAPVQPGVLELLSNINRSLKSIESMMREENERDRMRPEHVFQQMNRMPQSFRPEMFGPQSFGPQRFGPQPQPWQQSPANRYSPQWNNQPSRNQNQPDRAGPRNDGPRNDGPRNDGPRNDGPRNAGPGNDGPRDFGPTYDGQPRSSTQN